MEIQEQKLAKFNEGLKLIMEKYPEHRGALRAVIVNWKIIDSTTKRGAVNTLDLRADIAKEVKDLFNKVFDVHYR